MITMKIKLCENSDGSLIAEFIDGMNSISQNNSGKNVIQVIPEGFRLAEDEVLRIAFSTALNEDDPAEEVVGFMGMAKDFTDGSWKIEVPPIVSARRGEWYLDLQAASGFNESEEAYDYKRHLTDKLSFFVNASLTDVNGKAITSADIQSLYESAKSAVEAAQEIAAPGWVGKAEKKKLDKIQLNYHGCAAYIADNASQVLEDGSVDPSQTTQGIKRVSEAPFEKAIAMYSADKTLKSAEPKRPADVVNKQYADNTYFRKDGGAISGDVRIGGNLYLEGTSTVVDSDTIKVKDNIIVTNSDGLPLVVPSGLLILTSTTQAYGVMYEPSMDCVVVGLGTVTETENEETGEKNIDFSFLDGEKQALATRSTTIADGNFVYWNEEKSTLEDAGKAAKDFALALDVPDIEVAELEDGSYSLNVTQKEAAGAGVDEPIFPIGFIYLTLGDESPSEYFGGTWEKITNLFLVGAGDDYAVGSTGGAKTHTHEYSITLPSIGNVAMIYSNATNVNTTVVPTPQCIADGTDSMIETEASVMECTGPVSRADNLPPFLAVNMWKRIA
ncbi:MAG: hypothetical protein IJ308_04035 [Clostridia bacterium]|nr:hypothetical protein [Clostridia bacterium]